MRELRDLYDEFGNKTELTYYKGDEIPKGYYPMVVMIAIENSDCDGTILVISDNQVRYRQAIEVIEQLRKSGSKILGVVRNNIKKKDGGYYKKYYKNRYQ